MPCWVARAALARGPQLSKVKLAEPSATELLQCTEHMAAGLALAGLKPSEDPALAPPNSIDFVLAWYGTLLAGGRVVPIVRSIRLLRWNQIRDSGARFLLTVPDRAADMEKVVESLFVAGGSWQKVIDCNEPRRDVRSNPGDLAVLPYSSGTTGNPKGVMLTHSNILANIRQLQALGWVQQDDIVVNIFPLYHVAGLNSAMNTFLAAGATIVLMRRFDLQVS